MATQPPTTSDAPFGLQPNIAAGLAYLLGIIGGIIFLVGGGTNKFVKWSAAQSITLGVAYFVYYIAVMIVDIILTIAHLWIIVPLIGLLSLLVGLLVLVAYIYTIITGFQGKEVRLPIIGDLTSKIFASALG